MHFTKVKLTDIFEFKRLFKIILTSSGMAGLFALISYLVPLGDILNFFVYGTLYVISTYSVYFYTKQIDRSLLHAVLKGIASIKGA